MATKNHYIIVRADYVLLDAIETAAERKDVTLSEWVRSACEKQAKAEKRRAGKC